MNFSFNYFIKFPILKRLIPSLYKRYIFFSKDYFKKILVDNILYDLDLRHLIDRRFFFNRGYEDELFEPLSDIIKKYDADFFFDVGSCWGIYSLRLSKIHNKLDILAFDPIKKNIDRLQSSILKNKISNIKVNHTAVGNIKGSVELGATENYSPNYEINEPNATIKEISKIDYLDNLYDFRNKFIVFKIDTESYEYEVINGAKNLLKNNKCFCQIEIKNTNMEKVSLFLENLNFKLVSINKVNKTDFFFANFDVDKIRI